MKKMSTLFKKDENNLGRVTDVIAEENKWVLESGVPTRKYDGTSCALIEGKLYKRYDNKKSKAVPEGAIPCQDADTKSGHHPFWVPCNRSNPDDKYHFEAYDKLGNKKDNTYELCGPKINANKEKLKEHLLIPHGEDILDITDFSFRNIKDYLSNPENNIEGIVFHDSKGTKKMCKIRKKDFGVKR